LTRKFAQFLIFVVVLGVLVSLAVVVRGQVDYPIRLGPDFDERVRTNYLEDIEQQQPSIVFMGDSTLRESVDFDQLSQELGVPAYGVAVPGSSTALWYLVLKNNILSAVHKPDTLVLFTRKTLLTTPEFRVNGSYFAIIDEYAAQSQPLVRELSYVAQMTAPEQLAARYLPLYGERAMLRENIDDRIDHTLPLLFDCDEVCVKQALDTVFSADVYVETFMVEQDMVESYLWGVDKLIFNRQLQRSYLPEFVRMTKENGIQLILVEVKTWTHPDSTTTALLRTLYQHNLKTYADENDIPMISFADDPRLPLEYFPDGFHLGQEAVPSFTSLLAQELEPLLNRP
jgi:hypothetical protein